MSVTPLRHSTNRLKLGYCDLMSQLPQSTVPTLASQRLKRQLPRPSLVKLMAMSIVGLCSLYIWPSSAVWRLLFLWYLASASLLFLHQLIWALDLFPRPAVGFSLVGARIIAPFALALSSLWLGWGLFGWAIVAIYVLVLGDGCIGRKKLSKEIARVDDLEHPLGSGAQWMFAVSRRFTSKDASIIYERSIKPVLQEHGTIVECLYAEESSNNQDFWLNRMRLIFELADFHILVEHEFSSAVLVEQMVSLGLAFARKPYGMITEAVFGEHHPIAQARPRPSVLVVSPYAKRELVWLNRRSAVVPHPWHQEAGNDELKKLDAMITLLKKRRLVDSSAWALKRLGAAWVNELVLDNNSRENLAKARAERQKWSGMLGDPTRLHEYKRILEKIEIPIAELSALSNYMLNLLDGKVSLPSRLRDRYKLFRGLMLESLGQRGRLLQIPVLGHLVRGTLAPRVLRMAVMAPKLYKHIPPPARAAAPKK